MNTLHICRHHNPAVCGINALYEEITLPQTLANQMDVETQTATIEVAADLYSVPDHRVQQFVAQYVPIELKPFII